MITHPSNDPELWDAGTPASGERGLYVAISGNTAAGKSTLIRNVVEQVRASGRSAIGISERSFHHPYLTRMFADPGRYAFPIQLHFMLQRHLVLLRQLELGRIVVIERAHLDDELFLREHADAGNVAADQVESYFLLARALHVRLQAPDVLILLNPPPELSIARLREAEERGERPREFPNEEAKEGWVRRWHKLYLGLHEEYARRCAEDPLFSHTRLILIDSSATAAANAAAVTEALHERLSAVAPGP